MGFWNKKDKKRDLELEQLQEQMTDMDAKMTNVTELITKLTRVQFKTSKTTEEKLTNLETELSIQDQRDALLQENQQYKRWQDSSIENTLQLLDEIDHVLSGINDNDQVWYNLLEKWSRDLLGGLEKVGVFQMNILGKSFNPEVSESVKAVEKDSLNVTPIVPYQVIEVLKRGFTNTNGELTRKAHVITVREDTRFEGSN